MVNNEPTNNAKDTTMPRIKPNQGKRKIREETTLPRMDSQLFDEEDIMMPSEESETATRKSRGTTTMPTIIRDKSRKVKLVLDYDENGEVIGPNSQQYSSYLGVLGRTMIPINYVDWFKVPRQLKEKLWISVQAAFVVDPRSQKKSISAIASCWRSFKKHLTAYIYDFISDPDIIKQPPLRYRHIIEDEHWTSFLNYRLTEEFQVQRKKQQKNQACNMYPHRLSRKGYKGLKQEIKKKTPEVEVEKLDRSVLWKKARQNKQGEYDNEAIIKQVEKIDEVSKHVEEGILSIEGSDDILTKALGKPEHSGRVRAVGGSITPNTFFHVPRHVNHSQCNETMENFKAEICQLRAEMQAQFDAMGQQAVRTPQSDHGSNISKNENVGGTEDDFQQKKRNDVAATERMTSFPAKQIVQLAKKTMVGGNDIHPNNLNPKGNKGHPCKLAVGSPDNIVAHGTMYETFGPNERIHTVPLGDRNVRVSIDRVVVKNALLPFPIPGEDTTIGGAIGFHLAWPRDLVFIGTNQGDKKRNGLDDNEAISKNTEWDNNKESISTFALYVKTIPYNSVFAIILDKEIFGEEVPIQLQREDMEYICDLKELTAQCIMLYMSHLFSISKPTNKERSCLFFNPCTVNGPTTNGGNSKATLLATRLNEAVPGRLIFFPYNFGRHWILVVIDYLSSSTILVYYLDSLGAKVNQNLGVIVNTALKIDEATKGTKRRNIAWKEVKCPKQPPGVECGFYVMRYMKELISDRSILTNFNGKKTYTTAEIDEVRAEWISFVLHKMAQ